MGAKKLQLDWADLFKPIQGLSPGEYEMEVKRETVPILFVPGIMGTRLKNTKNAKIWDPDSPVFMLKKYGLIHCTAAKKKQMTVGDAFDESFLVPYEDDKDHNDKVLEAFPGAAERRWGGVAWSSYGKVLTRLHKQEWSPAVRACFDLPVYAFGYNWSASNSRSGKQLKAFIDELKKSLPNCKQVIIVTHSMGGLVTRSALLEHGADASVLGVIHGVQPATGAAAAYWRMKAGFERTDLVMSRLAAWVLGTNGEEVTALLANMPGGLQLLPSKHYTDNAGSKQWLKFADFDGKVTAARPQGCPYEEIYKNKSDFWRLVNPAFLTPGKRKDDLTGPEEAWEVFENFADTARAFHDNVKLTPNAPTHAFYGAGKKFRTPDKVVYKVAEHGWKQVGKDLLQLSLKTALAAEWGGPWGAGASLAAHAITHTDWWQSRGGFTARITKDGVTLEATLQSADGAGDGTVPESSGKAVEAPAKAFNEVAHEPAFTHDSEELPVLTFTTGLIEKFCVDKIKKKTGT